MSKRIEDMADTTKVQRRRCLATINSIVGIVHGVFVHDVRDASCD